MNRLWRSMIGSLAVLSLMGTVIPGASADDEPTAGPTITAPAEYPTVPAGEPSVEPTITVPTESPTAPADVIPDGWKQDGGRWFYYEKGAKKTGWLTEGGAWYYFAADGAMATGWTQVGGAWYYFASNGAMMTGWISSGGRWFYLNGSGAMATGWTQVGSAWYYFGGGGQWVSGTSTCPDWAPIKGNKDSGIYHRPGQQSYDRTVAEQCFSSSVDAERAGYRAAKR